MRTLYVSSGPERVHGMITDLLKNDMTQVAAAIQLAAAPESQETAPVSGWVARDTASMIGLYTVIASFLYTPVTEGFYNLWAKWTVAPETVVTKIGKFRVLG